jgi:hypothetical protein
LKNKRWMAAAAAAAAEIPRSNGHSNDVVPSFISTAAA